MKKTVQYIFGQIWYLIILLILSIVFVLAGQGKTLLWGFFDAYFKFALYVIAVGFISMFAGAALPRKFSYEKFPFRDYFWEKSGNVYRHWFRIDKWKDLVFDVGKAGFGMTEKHLSKPDSKDVFLLIQETCVAEFTHFALIVFSPVILCFITTFWRWVLLFFYIILNLMYVMIQRYNRPRLVKLYEKLTKYQKS